MRSLALCAVALLASLGAARAHYRHPAPGRAAEVGARGSPAPRARPVGMTPAIVADPSAMNVWPLPLLYSGGDNCFPLASTFALAAAGAEAEGSDVLTLALARYQDLILFSGPPMGAAPSLDRRGLGSASSPLMLSSVAVSVTNASVPLTLAASEAYKLTMTFPVATLEADTVWGALRGLETLSQLVTAQLPNNTYTACDWAIEDEPRYPFRGLLLDTSRHFYGVDSILQLLDSMAYTKLNTFLWHITDDQSFPIWIERFPQLAQQGAYTPNHVYYPDDVRRIARFAKERGIMVIPEFDVPGHCGSWAKGIPEIVVCGNETGVSGGLLDPTNPLSFEVLDALYGTMQSLFNDVGHNITYIELGGDEVIDTCWNESAHIRAFAAEHNVTTEGYTEDTLICLFHRLQVVIANNNGMAPLIWDDGRFCNLTPGITELADGATIVDVWSVDDAPAQLQTAQLGLKQVLSSYCYYLNSSTYMWMNNYECEPTNFTTNATLQDTIVGGHAARWSEFSDDTNMMNNIYPSLLGMSEKLWTSLAQTCTSCPEGQDHLDYAAGRLLQWRCVALRRGIPIQPIGDTGFCDVEYTIDYKPPYTTNPAQTFGDDDTSRPVSTA